MTRKSDALRERRRTARAPWRRWYRTRRWRERRARQLHDEPLCRYCVRVGHFMPPPIATDVDHVVPHRGDPELFWEGELQSLCRTCHAKIKQLEELHGFSSLVSQQGDDAGWPTDPAHPFNSGRRLRPKARFR